MTERRFTGGCLCGRIRYQGHGDWRVHYCHCGMCRRATGSAFAVLVWVESDRITWIGGEPACFSSSPIARRGFCPNCGTPLTLRYEGKDDIALHAGTLDEPGLARPQYHYGVEGRLDWVDCGRALPEKETQERW